MTVSQPLDEVRAQYEALPYPPRDPREEAARLITGTPSHILEVNHYLFSGRLNFNRPFRALVAGGGTGDEGAKGPVEVEPAGEKVVIDLEDVARRAGNQPQRLLARVAGWIRQRLILSANLVQRLGDGHKPWFMLQILQA